MDESVFSYLSRDSLLTVDMAEQLRRGTGAVLYAGDDGVLLRKEELLFLYCDSEEAALRILDGHVRPDSGLVLHNPAFKEAIGERFGFFTGAEECYQCSYPHSVPATTADIRPLDGRYAERLASLYGEDRIDYLRYLLDKGAMVGVFEGEELAGFAGQHDDGSMGLLEVWPAYRRKGYGSELERYYIRLEQSRGHLPYCQVYVSNGVSLAIQRQMGAQISENTLIWLFMPE